MPEYPDIVLYIEALAKRIQGRTLKRIDVGSPFLLRTAAPSISSAERKRVVDLRRLGKRICLGLEDELWLVLHLMIAGRLHWKEGHTKLSKRHLAAFHFENGTLTLTEAGTQKRASLHLVAGETELRKLDPGGLEIVEVKSDGDQFVLADAKTFAGVLKSGNHTLKRALTNPRLFSGIGNAYSDEFFSRRVFLQLNLHKN